MLFNGSDVSTELVAGTVLVCIDNVYGTVCDDFWDSFEAVVVCQKLGHEQGKPYFLSY